MDYAKFQEGPLPTGRTYLRINHIEINYPIDSLPVMVLSVERRTDLSDGTGFGTQLDSVQIILDGKQAQFDIFDRVSGNVRSDAKPLSIGDFSDMVFSIGRFALQAREAVIAAQKEADAAQAAADRLKADPIDGGISRA